VIYNDSKSSYDSESSSASSETFEIIEKNLDILFVNNQPQTKYTSIDNIFFLFYTIQVV